LPKKQVLPKNRHQNSLLLSLKRFAKLADGDKVQLVGFGAFMTRKRKSHEKRNPRYYRLVYHIFAG